MLLYKPDKLALETRALNAACAARQTNPVALLAACGAIPSTHDYHFNRFLLEAFPQGTVFPPHDAPVLPELPRAPVRAFSIDDATTTEIDDAFSVRPLPNGHFEIGIHIAAPALAVPHGSVLEAAARSRLSTVYTPGRKITMLPDTVIGCFTLAAGGAPPALSLYVEVAPDGRPLKHATRLECVPIAANLRLDAIGERFAEAAVPGEPEGGDQRRLPLRGAPQSQGARREPQTPPSGSRLPV